MLGQQLFADLHLCCSHMALDIFRMTWPSCKITRRHVMVISRHLKYNNRVVLKRNKERSKERKKERHRRKKVGA